MKKTPPSYAGLFSGGAPLSRGGGRAFPCGKAVGALALSSALALLSCLASCEADGTSGAAGSGAVPGRKDVLENHQPNNKPVNTAIRITVGSSTFTATLSNNAAAAAFKALLPLTVRMEDVNGNEKYGRLSKNLPAAAASPGAIHAGDLMLWGSGGLVLFYKTFSTSYSYTPLGRVDDASGLAKALGAGNVTVTFALK